MNKSDLMSLPTSITSWIILRDYFQEYGEVDILLKLIDNYYSNIPLYEVYRLFERLENTVGDKTFQSTLDFLFRKNMTTIRC